VGTEPGLTLSY